MTVREPADPLVRVGVDLVETEKVARLAERFPDRLPDLFTAAELAYALRGGRRSARCRCTRRRRRRRSGAPVRGKSRWRALSGCLSRWELWRPRPMVVRLLVGVGIRCSMG